MSSDQLTFCALATGFLSVLFLLVAGCIVDSSYPRGAARPWFLAFLVAFAATVALGALALG